MASSQQPCSQSHTNPGTGDTLQLLVNYTQYKNYMSSTANINFQSTEMSSYNKKKKQRKRMIVSNKTTTKITDVDKLHLLIFTPFDASMGRKCRKKMCWWEGRKAVWEKDLRNTKCSLTPEEIFNWVHIKGQVQNYTGHREVGDLYQHLPFVSVMPILERITKMGNKPGF